MSTLHKLILTSLLILLLCPVTSFAKTDEASMLEQAKEHYSTGNYYYASTWLERILRDYPASPRREEVLVMLAKVFVSSGRDERASETVRELLKSFPKEADTLDPSLLKLAVGVPRANMTPAEAKEAEAKAIKAAKAKAAETIAAAAKVAAEKAAAAKLLEAKIAKGKAAEAKAAAQRAAEEKAAEVKAAEEKAAEIKAAEVKATRIDAFTKRLAEQKALQLKAAEEGAAKVKAEAEAAAAKAAAARAAAAEAAEAAAYEAKTPAAKEAAVKAKEARARAKEAKAREEAAKVAEAEGAAAKAAERREAEARIAEQKASEELFAELKASEQRNIEARAAESAAEKAAEQRAAALLAAEQKAAEQGGAGQTTAEEKRTEPKAVVPKVVVPKVEPAVLQPAALRAVPTRATAGSPPVNAAPGSPLDAPARSLSASVAPAPSAGFVGHVGETAKLPGKSEQASQTVTYTLQIGEYVAKQAVTDAKRKVKNAGMEPVVEPGAKKKEPMIRLSLGDYPSQEAAQKQLEKLHAAKVDGFFLKGGDQKYHVYAGSYSDEKSAAAEVRRLAALGIKPVMKRVVVSTPTFLLTAGAFPTREEALARALELEKQGVKSVVVERPATEKLP